MEVTISETQSRDHLSNTLGGQASVPALIYRTALGYELAMLALYGRHYLARYEAIANLIEPRSTVLDLCCGPAILYRRYLRQKAIDYTGFDLNELFIRKLIQAGAQGETRDLLSDEDLPANDYVIMQASLYHFLPNPEPVLRRMMSASKRALIISEPVRNLTNSKSRVVRLLSGRMTNAGRGNQVHRFDEESLDTVFAKLDWMPTSTFFISGGREKVYLFGTA
jgi:hypothetical protein